MKLTPNIYRVTTPSGAQSRPGLTQKEATELARQVPGSVIEPPIQPPCWLVLQRSVGQSILIGDDIRVSLSQVRGTRARLVISAPAHVRIVREEIAQ
jgi:carbon storage regulator